MKNYIVTIGREFACGGREIGKKLAEKMKVPYYDNELILMAAKVNGIDPESYQKYDEKSKNIFGGMLNYNLNFANTYGWVINNYAINDELFLTQSEIIKEIAAKPCVIIGRCADYILKGRDDVISVFLYASLEEREKRVKEKYTVEKTDKIKKTLLKADKQRANYYETYTGEKWGDLHNYNLAINTTNLEADQVAEIIYLYMQTLMNRG